MTVISLHAFLDRGGDLRALPFLDILAESIVVDRRLRPEPWLREAAASFRRLAGTMLDDPERHDLATLLLWEAEAYENDDVAARFERALPRHKLEELLTGTQEARHPHRLMVTGVDWFTCGACGDDYDEALAVVIDGTDGITYCSACIGLASLAVGRPGRVLDPHEPAAAAAGAAHAPPGPADDGPRPAGRGRSRVRAPVALVLLAAAVMGSSGLASAGVLPASLQTVAHDTLAFVGIQVPDGGPGARPGGPGTRPGAEPATGRGGRAGRGAQPAGRQPRSEAPARATEGEKRRPRAPGEPVAVDARDPAGESTRRSAPPPTALGPVLVSTSVPAGGARPSSDATEVPSAAPTTTVAGPTTTAAPPGSTATTTTTTSAPAALSVAEPVEDPATTSTTSTTGRGGRRNSAPPPPPTPAAADAGEADG